jgi:vacuolar-type H+-ATPase subunit C/Vma6
VKLAIKIRKIERHIQTAETLQPKTPEAKSTIFTYLHEKKVELQNLKLAARPEVRK